MTFLRAILIFGSFLLMTSGWAQESQPISTEDEAKFAQTIEEGARLASAGKQKDAIDYYDKVSAIYEEKFRDSKSRILCARWPTESLMYLLEAAKENRDTKVLSSNWAYAYYLKAYSLLELGRMSEAKVLLERAIALSPRNSQFLSELGNVYQREKNWPLAINTFKLAESAAREFSPPNVKDAELSKAWRGIAYVLVEQNQLDDAEKMYRQCLDLNKNDTRALNELRYILSMKAKQGAR